MRNPEYLGDGVYVGFDGYRLKIMANSHENPTDTVYLGQSEIEALFDFYRSLFQSRPGGGGR